METLKQSRLFKKYQFEIGKSELKIKLNSGGDITEWSVPFEELGTQIVIKRKSKAISYVFMFIAVVLLLAIIFSSRWETRSSVFVAMVFWGILGSVVYHRSKGFLLLTGNQQQTIEFFLDSPSEEEVKQFVESVTLQSKKYLKNKYAEVDLDLPIEPQLSRMMWLKDNEIITNAEFDTLKSLLLKGNDSKKSSLGFN